MKLLIALLLVIPAFGQCGSSGRLIVNPITGLLDCTATVGAGTGSVTNIGTTAPITGGSITTTGTIACATCTTSAAALTANRILIGGGLQAITTDADFTFNTSTNTLNFTQVVDTPNQLTIGPSVYADFSAAVQANNTGNWQNSILYHGTQANLDGIQRMLVETTDSVTNAFSFYGFSSASSLGGFANFGGILSTVGSSGSAIMYGAQAFEGYVWNLSTGTIGIGSAFKAYDGFIADVGVITTQVGYETDDLTVGVTNIGFRSNVSAGANKWAFYGAGTADSKLFGDLTVDTIKSTTGQVFVCADTAGKLVRSATACVGTI